MDAFYVILESVLLAPLPFNTGKCGNKRDPVILFNTGTLDSSSYINMHEVPVH